MGKYNMLASSYHLPFQVRYVERSLSVGAPVFLRLHANSTNQVSALADIVDLFTSLAGTGALGGGEGGPWLCKFSPLEQASRYPNELCFYVEDACLADEALTVLVHLFLSIENCAGLEWIEVRAADSSNDQLFSEMQQSESTYPLVYAPLPFELIDRDPEGGSFSFEVSLTQPVEEAGVAWLNAALAVWSNAISRGGYSLAPIPWGGGYVEFDDEMVTSYGCTIEWAIFKLRADPVGAIDALLNILAVFSQRCQKISQVEIF